MATRSIVTSQPDVACDVCMRRLLRGERPDTFLAGGRRLTVCELCAPRAVHEGWLRERDAQAEHLAPARLRRGRGLFARLRGRVEPAAFGPVLPESLEFDHMQLEEDGEQAAVVAGLGGGIAVAAELSDDAPEEAEHPEDGLHADEPAEEGSWRDAWMFVAE